MWGTAEVPTRCRDVRRDGKFSQTPPRTAPPAIPYYLHRTRCGQVGTHTVLPQYFVKKTMGSRHFGTILIPVAVIVLLF